MTSAGTGAGNERIELTREDAVAIITLNRPPANAIDALMLEELGRAVDSIEADRDIRVAIITGAGPTMFSAGADVRAFAAGSPQEMEQFIHKGYDLFERMAALPKPIIAAVNGFALGGGNELAMACDIRVAASKARFGQLEINLGLIPAWRGIERLIRLIGGSRAQELLLSGGMVDAEEAMALGLVSKVVPDDELTEHARGLARKLAEQAPLAMAEIKRLSAAMDGGGDREDARGFLRMIQTQDGKEGIAAFLEKRRPSYSGK